MSDEELEREILAHRYRYYVLVSPCISDWEYDNLERRGVRRLPWTSLVHQVGSDRAESYPRYIIYYVEERGL